MKCSCCFVMAYKLNIVLQCESTFTISILFYLERQRKEEETRQQEHLLI